MASKAAIANVVQYEAYLYDEATELTWLGPDTTYGMTLEELEAEIESGSLYADNNWRFASWDEVFQLYRNVSDAWFYDFHNNYWEFEIDDEVYGEYYNHDVIGSINRISGYSAIATNRDGELGENIFYWISKKEFTIYPVKSRNYLLDYYAYE